MLDRLSIALRIAHINKIEEKGETLMSESSHDRSSGE